MGTEKILIVYYSRTGKTKRVAENLSNMFSCDIEEIVDNKQRKGILVFLSGGKDAIFKSKTSIQKTTFNPEQYDIVIIGSPVWASHVVPAIRTYIEEWKGKFKKVAFFCTQTSESTKGLKIFDDMKCICGKKPICQLKVSLRELENNEFEKKLGIFKAEIINSN